MKKRVKISKNLNYNQHRTTSPRGGRRGCLCWDKETYSIECCDGTYRSQGIGSI